MRAPEFWFRDGPLARITAAALAPLGALYGASVSWKHGSQIPYRSHAAVACIGNLTVGGTGKTPLVIAIAQALQAQRVRVFCLTRGYGRRDSGALLVDPRVHDVEEAGDEALLLARAAPTIVSRDRAEGARLAETHGAHVIVMDDGHQNFSLAKDLSIVVVDGESAFGNGKIVPAGPLRETVRRGLSRADAIVVMGNGNPALPGFDGPVLRATMSAERRFDGRRVVAFAGLGRPAKFFDMLHTLGAELVESHSYADHYRFSPKEIAALKRRASLAEAALITTEKDLMRLRPRDRVGIEVLSVRAILSKPAAFARLLEPLVAGAPIAP